MSGWYTECMKVKTFQDKCDILEKIADDLGQQIFQLEMHVNHFRRMCEQGVLTAAELEYVNLMQANLEKLKEIKTRILAEDERQLS